jgi:tetratricopeptide (TPR) repeat protein
MTTRTTPSIPAPAEVSSQAATEAARLRELAVAAKARGELKVALRHLRRALRLLGVHVGRPPDSSSSGGPPRLPVAHPRPQTSLAASILISLAHAEAESGRTTLGYSLLMRADDLVAPDERGTLYGQRGLLLLRTGRAQASLAEFDNAVATIDPAREPVELARVLLNRSVAHLEIGAFARARSDLERCGELARAADQPLLAVKVLHNLGCCDLAVGDLPAALRTIGQAVEEFAPWPSWQPVAINDLAKALLSAGLAADAATELDAAIELFRSERMSQDQGVAEAMRAEASLLMGDADAARDWARRARAGFRRRGNNTAAAAAELIELHAERRRAMIPPRTLARRAFDLAARLDESGVRHDAAAARLLGIRALTAAGAIAEATERARSLPRLRSATPLTVRMLRHLTLAELAAASPVTTPRTHTAHDVALRTLRRGLTELAQHRAQLGSIDLQTGTAALGVQLSTYGLALSLADSRPRDVFTWSELSRAQSLRIAPVQPPADPALAAAVAELRKLEFDRRDAVLAGQPADPTFDARIAALKRKVRQGAWPAQGDGSVAKIATLAEVSATLGEQDQAMLCLFQDGQSLRGLLIAGDTRRVLPLADAAATYEAERRLRADITVLTGRMLPSRMEKALMQSIGAHAERLADSLLGPEVISLVGDRELVVVPSGVLAAIPWQLLPPLRGRPVTVAPSATSWLAARRADTHQISQHGSPVIIAGPLLRNAGSEAAAVASQYPDSLVMTGAAATVSAALPALEGATMAHLAVHGKHEPDNALFSKLELADGPLMAYDLLRLNAPPKHVVLSACELGRVSTRPGDEPLGMVTTLLHLGSTTVIAAVAPVLDGSAVELMTAYHRHLNAGLRPAQALAAATVSNPLAVFNCYGAS